MQKFNLSQKLLFPVKEVFNIDPLEKYEVLFSFLPSSPLKKLYSFTGRPPLPYEAILKALIYKNLKGLTTLADLVRELSDNPEVAFLLGFHPEKLPSVERFSCFLKNIPNFILQSVKELLVQQLIALGEISGKYISFDSCNILAEVKENNLKTSVKDRFNKTRIPAGDPDCRLGVMIHFPKPFQKEIRYFWGYKNFVLADSLSELPVLELTRPANIHDSKVALFLLQTLKEKFKFKVKGVISDSAWDSQEILSFILSNLKAKPYIPRNPGATGHTRSKFGISPSGKRICLAGFEMTYWGKYKEGNRIRLKFALLPI